MPTVFVTNEMQHNYAEAEQYGDITFLSADDFSNTKGSIRNEAIISDMRHKLKKFDPDQDWIVLTGSPYITAAVFLILGGMGLRSLKILRWDNRGFKYIPFYLELRREDKETESE